MAASGAGAALATCVWQLLLLLWVWGCHASCFRNRSHDSHTVLRFFIINLLLKKKKKNQPTTAHQLLREKCCFLPKEVKFALDFVSRCLNLSVLAGIFTGTFLRHGQHGELPLGAVAV